MIKVLKFGGTSVGSAQNMKRVAEIVRREQATVTVLSAMSGTTDALVQISKLAADGDLAAIGKVLDMLRDKYSTCIDGLLTATRQKAFDRMEAAWTTILAAATDFQPYTSERTIIAQGELLTYLYIFTIGGAVFTTAVSNSYSASQYLENKTGKNRAVVCVTVALLSLLLSFIGFENIVARGYFVFGLTGLLLMFKVLFKKRTN